MYTLELYFTTLTLVLVLANEDNKISVFRSVNLDYTEIAKQAEAHKPNILQFLNQSLIQNQYKNMYRMLADKLNDPIDPSEVVYQSNTRRDSFRRIVSGHNTSIFAVPWQVSLRDKSFPICGGSILTDIWIITAAHCLIRAQAPDLSVRLGSSWKTQGGEMYDVKQTYVHPKYVGKTKINDVGLVKLHTPMRFSARALPIKITTKLQNIFANVSAIVSGWGKLREGGPSAAFLQSTMVSMIAMKLCKRSALNRKAIDPDSMFCAGSFRKHSPDACQGDSGGPIVYEGVLIGVVSWGLGCARGNFPGVYTRLAFPVIWDWVHKHIQEKFDSKIVTI